MPVVETEEGVSAVSQPSDSGTHGKILPFQTVLPFAFFVLSVFERHASVLGRVFGEFGNTPE